MAGVSSPLRELLKRVASSLNIHVKVVQESSHRLLGILGSTGPSQVALSINEAILKPTRLLWQTPSSLLTTAKRTEHRYHVPSQSYEHFYTLPSLDSLVVSAVNKGHVTDDHLLPQRIKKQTDSTFSVEKFIPLLAGGFVLLNQQALLAR